LFLPALYTEANIEKINVMKAIMPIASITVIPPYSHSR
jgi:hypothetical protein